MQCHLRASFGRLQISQPAASEEARTEQDFSRSQLATVAWVGEGAVGSRLLGGLRVFRYEIRCWRDGRIPDVAEAVDSPQRLTEDPLIARRVLELVRKVPTHVWGRDELGTGGMWNSNSLIAWLLVGGVIDPRLVRLPACGRAPGWDAGLALARRAVARAVAA
jgi:hypothetical protein